MNTNLSRTGRDAVPSPVGMDRARARAPLQSAVLIAGDVLSGLLAHLMVNFTFHLFGHVHVEWQVSIVWLLLWLLWRAYQGLYPGYGQSPQTELRKHTVSTLQVGLAQLAAAFTVGRVAPGGLGILLVWFIALLIGLPVRYLMRSLLIYLKRFGRPVTIIGAGQTAQLIISHLLQHPGYGLRPVAAYDDNRALHGTSLSGVQILGDINLALIQPKTEQAIIGIPSARAEAQQQLVNAVYAVFPLTWTVPDLLGVPNQAMQPHNIGALASLEIKNNLRSVRSQVLKRALDLFLSVIGLLVLSPLLIILTLLIYFDDPGPVFYKAQRLGHYNSFFACFKFRSMYVNAEERLIELLKTDALMREEYEIYHKLRDDPRVTRIGKILRKFSLDELPQILNVIIGNMSLVGPRPYLPREREKMGLAAQIVVQVRPGMTGYWQVSGRNSSTFAERLDMDRFYITNWSPWLDLVILLQTVGVVLNKKGAY